MRELTRKINEHINSVRRELKHLVELGLLTEIEHDRKKYYQVNTEFVLYPELKGLILKARLTMEREFIAQLHSKIVRKLHFLADTIIKKTQKSWTDIKNTTISEGRVGDCSAPFIAK